MAQLKDLIVSGAARVLGKLYASEFVGKLTGNADTSTKATQDSTGQQINTTYIKGLSVNGKTITYTKGNNTTGTITTQDTNTWRPLGTTADTACAGNDARLSNSRPASDVYAWAKAQNKPSYSWGEITGKPGTFTPSSHTHSYLTLYGSGRPTSANLATSTNGTGSMFHFVATSSMTTGKPPSDSNVLQMNWDSTGGYDSQLAISTANASMYVRGQSGGTWGSWNTVLSSNNYTSYTVTKTGGGASGTWGINVTGSSASCTGNAKTATTLQTARTINGTSFNGSGNITTANWGTARTITVGNTGKSVNGSGNVSWSLGEIGVHVSNKEPTASDGKNGDVWIVYEG